jgi:hypothetical protein
MHPGVLEPDATRGSCVPYRLGGRGDHPHPALRADLSLGGRGVAAVMSRLKEYQQRRLDELADMLRTPLPGTGREKAKELLSLEGRG